MNSSNEDCYILTVYIGRRSLHGIHIYNHTDAVAAQKRLIAAGAKPSDIKIDTYESVFGGGLNESKAT